MPWGELTSLPLGTAVDVVCLVTVRTEVGMAVLVTKTTDVHGVAVDEAAGAGMVAPAREG